MIVITYDAITHAITWRVGAVAQVMSPITPNNETSTYGLSKQFHKFDLHKV